MSSIQVSVAVLQQPDGGGGALHGAVAVDSQGMIVVATTVAISGANNVAIARLTPGGALDTTFNGTGSEEAALGFSEAQTTAVTLLPDDRIVAGALVITSGSQRELIAARFATDGTRDGAFGSAFAPASQPCAITMSTPHPTARRASSTLPTVCMTSAPTLPLPQAS